MVVAEVPLWISHGTQAGQDPASLQNNPSGNGGAANQTESSSPSKNARAIASLGLWRKDGRAAVYGVHIHPHLPLLATAGGDGTVRIWNTGGTLFVDHVGGRFVATKRNDKAHPDQSGEEGDGVIDKQPSVAPSGKPGYVSTSSSGHSTGEDSSSSGAATDEDEDLGPSTQLPSTMNNTSVPPQPVIHDLNSVVRSRKHPEAASPERHSYRTTAPPAASQMDTNNKVKNHKKQRLVCTLTAHTGSSVLAVRFSPSGKLLASAGDDGCVCLYAPAESASPQTAQWHRILLCRGHQLDAVGLAWSPDEQTLVSVSLDRETPIVVWKVADVAADGQAPAGSMIRSPHRVLGRDAHQSTVKGVCFDPVGSYLCTSGDDPAICVWRAHGDWGLERRIDAKDGIFRKWGQDMPLSSQSLFRRLSWSTDGMHILATNATVKNKHVASTINREQWTSTTTTAAHLVGHQQPVVVASHAPVLLQGDTPANDDNDPDEEPSYATLVALGDKKGFVTIWSTRKSRPLFKLQCSEGRRTVTDLSWGVANDHLVLAVGLLDGQVVMLRLSVPEEVGPVLSKANQAKLFRLRYGIDTNDPTSYGRLMDDGRPKLIETALQMTLEKEDDDDVETDEPVPPLNTTGQGTVNQLLGRSKKDGTKKRVQPVLLTVQKKSSVSAPPPRKKVKATKVSALQHAQQVAEKMAAARTKPSSKSNTVTAAGSVSPPTSPIRQVTQTTTVPPLGYAAMINQSHAAFLTHSTEHIHAVDLEVKPGLLAETSVRWTAECHNRASQVPLGARGPGLPCLDVSLRRDGLSVWQDQIIGTSCCALAGNERILAVGCTDGCIQLYGTSPVSGWRSESALRAFPPLVTGHPIIALEIKTWEGSPTLLVIAADGSFGVYRLEPTLGKVFGGSILPAMSHMANATLSHGEQTVVYPKLSRCQMTDKGQILLLLSSSNTTSSGDSGELNSNGNSSFGGSIQGFVYHRDLELWMRISDSRFVLSDFYSSLPLRQNSQEPGPLSRLDDAVRLGAMEATLKPSQRRRQDTSTTVATMYTMDTDGGNGNFVPTKAHCEDRLACAIALQSASEFRHWLGRYAKTLASGGQEQLLRTLVDVLLSDFDGSGWWLLTGVKSLDLDRRELLRKVVLPAMGKNRALQRLTNELAVELNQGH